VYHIPTLTHILALRVITLIFLTLFKASPTSVVPRSLSPVPLAASRVPNRPRRYTPPSFLLLIIIILFFYSRLLVTPQRDLDPNPHPIPPLPPLHHPPSHQIHHKATSACVARRNLEDAASGTRRRDSGCVTRAGLRGGMLAPTHICALCHAHSSQQICTCCH
jgi:hypothetical protein